MTRDQVYTFIGMSMNAAKQEEENHAAIKAETGIDYAGVYFYSTPKIQVLERDLKTILDTLGESPAVCDRSHEGSDYPYEISVMVEGLKIFAIFRAVPEWALGIEAVNG